MTTNLRWNPTVHAVRRIKERCGVEETQAKSFINQIMASAKYVTTQPDGNTVYKHENRDIMIVVDTEKNTVITLHSATQTPTGAPSEVKPTQSIASITVDRIATAVKREFKRMQTEALRDIRKLKEEYAAIYIEIAQLKYNKIRCKAPHTQLHIQTKIDELVARTAELTKVIDAKLTEIQQAETEVKAVVSEQ